MATKITLRGDTKANWVSVNPVLSAREMVIETDTNRTKIGDGISTYTELMYASNSNSYKTYIGKISQSGTSDPIVSEIVNEIGVITPSRVSAGVYNFACEINAFNIYKTFYCYTPVGLDPKKKFTTTRLSPNTIRITSDSISIVENNLVGTPQDELITNGFLEIRVYE